MSILSRVRHANSSYLAFIIIIVIIVPIFLVIRNQVLTQDEIRQDFENRLLGTIAQNQRTSMDNDLIKNHNSGVIVHNQEILVHNQQVLLKRGSFDVLGGIRNDTRTDFIPIGNESIDLEESFNDLIANASINGLGRISSGGLSGPIIMNDSELAKLLK